MRVVVIGFGSIGKRHVNNLISLGINDITLCRTSALGNELNLREIEHLEDILKIQPDFVIVSNPTYLHGKSLEFLIQNQINILCEKPLLYKAEEWSRIKESLDCYNGFANVVFNLRFHPCIKKAKEILINHELGMIHSARFFTGQYLPDWRPGTNHLDSYSANKGLGGGVVMDLVHEIDASEYLLGKPDGEIKSIVSRISDVTVDSVDIAEILYQTSNKSVINIHLDYLFRGYARNIMILGSEQNLYCDLFENTIKITGNQNQLVYSFKFEKFERNDMYLHLVADYIKGLNNPDYQSGLPSFYENESVMNTCFQINN